AYHNYDKPISFVGRLRTHLKNYLDDLTQDLGLARGSWEGDPYLWLNAFQIEHHRIFFGRDEEIHQVLQRLRAREKDGCASVVIIGASGSGKSSLARSGVLGSLIHEPLDSDPVDWRYAVLTPSEIAGDLLSGLARHLMSDAALPELRSHAEGLDDLIRCLRTDPVKAFDLRIKQLLRGTGDGKKGQRRLLLLVDQLEELFTHPAISRAEAECFLEAILAFSKGGGVWTLSTIRSDFYRELQQSPALMALKGGWGAFDLRPPEAGDIHRLITGPAALAGLVFAKNELNVSLDQIILNESAGSPEALPLLEYFLSELYQRRSTDGTLTFAQYENLGGVEGALGLRAERVYNSLSKKSQDALPVVLNQLVAVDKDSVVRRRAKFEDLTDAPEKQLLVEVYISERLLVSDHGEVVVAHEALLRRWDRAAQWIEAHHEALGVKTRVHANFERWKKEGCPDDLLLGQGKPVAEAESLLTKHEEILNKDLVGYIRDSADYHAARSNRARRRWQTAAAFFAVLALAACAAGVYAWTQRNVAEKEKIKAEGSIEETTHNSGLAAPATPAHFLQAGTPRAAERLTMSSGAA
ncbi:MAG: ATP-binding protein, partial [Pseudomonadota bacterium]